MPPSGPYSGALPLADRPCYRCRCRCPPCRRTTIGSATFWPISAGSGCEWRTRFMSMTTTYEAPVSVWTDVATLWIDFRAALRLVCRHQGIAGSPATVCAMAASARTGCPAGRAPRRRTARSRRAPSSPEWPAGRRRSGWTTGACDWASLPIVTVPKRRTRRAPGWRQSAPRAERGKPEVMRVTSQCFRNRDVTPFGIYGLASQ